MLIARSKLIADGVTSWDARLRCKVEHRRRHPFVWLLVIVFVLGVSITFWVLERLAV
jgi:hypothetical protein